MRCASIGGLLLGARAVMIYIRRAVPATNDPVGDFPIFLVLAIPAVYLYGARLHPARRPAELRPWQAVHSVFGLIFVPLALGSSSTDRRRRRASSLNTFWIFGVDRGARLLRRRRSRGSAFQLLARLDRGDRLLVRRSGTRSSATRASARPLRHLPRPARDPRDRPARRRPLRSGATTPAMRPGAGDARPRRRRPGPLEGVRALHRRRDRGGDRLRASGSAPAVGNLATRSAERSPPIQTSNSLGHPAAGDLARPGRDRLADRHARTRLRRRRSGCSLFLVIAGLDLNSRTRRIRSTSASGRVLLLVGG